MYINPEIPIFVPEPEPKWLKDMRFLVNNLILPKWQRIFKVRPDQVAGLAKMVNAAAEEERKSRKS